MLCQNGVYFFCDFLQIYAIKVCLQYAWSRIDERMRIMLFTNTIVMHLYRSHETSWPSRTHHVGRDVNSSDEEVNATNDLRNAWIKITSVKHSRTMARMGTLSEWIKQVFWLNARLNLRNMWSTKSIWFASSISSVLTDDNLWAVSPFAQQHLTQSSTCFCF